MIRVEVVADSLSPQGDRLISVLATFPRIILSEVNTHRMLSKNTSSSRAIPFNKMVEAVEENPFVPIAFQKHHSGMQGNEYLQGIELQEALDRWNDAKNYALESAKDLYSTGATKQLCNRLLEPFMWTTMLITGSKEGWNNFFELRCPSYFINNTGQDYYFKSKKEAINFFGDEEAIDSLSSNKEVFLKNLSDLEWLQINKGQAEIHLMDLAEKIYDAFNESTPKQLQAGEWHIPFEDKIHIDGIQGVIAILKDGSKQYQEAKWITEQKVKISTAMSARTSYTVVGDEKEIDYERMIKLHDKLIEMRHDSPLEHCARAMSDEEYNSFLKGSFWDEYIYRPYEIPEINLENSDKSKLGWCYNIKGFIPYRYMVDSKRVKNKQK